MKDSELMEMAITESLKSGEPLKCGCVIALDGKVVATSYNSQRSDCNATAHAEIKALAEAGKKLDEKNLVGCVAYCSCEPCTMCLSAMIYAKVEKLYYAVSLANVSDKHIKISTDELIEKAPRTIEVVKNYMEKEAKDALDIA